MMRLFLIGLVSITLIVGCRSSMTPKQNDYRIPKSENTKDISWVVIEKMWNDVDIYSSEKKLQEGLQGATPGQRAVFACTWYMNEVNNGGHDQFFFNSTGILTDEALKGFGTLNAHTYKVILEKAVALFSESNVPKEHQERTEALEKIPKGSFSPLDNAFYEAQKSEPLETTFEHYIQEHPEEFFKPES